jgi:hypothetical protein
VALDGAGQVAELSRIIYVRMAEEGDTGRRTVVKAAGHRLRERRPVEGQHELAQDGLVIAAVPHRLSL